MPLDLKLFLMFRNWSGENKGHINCPDDFLDFNWTYYGGMFMTGGPSYKIPYVCSAEIEAPLWPEQKAAPVEHIMQ